MGVGSSPPSTDFVIPVDITEGFYPGLALFGSGGSNASLTLILRDASGTETARTSKSLDNNAHLAIFVGGPGQLFPTVTNFRGTLEVQSATRVSALTLRMNAAPLPYTSLPVVAAAHIPDLRGQWQGGLIGYIYENSLTGSP